jgi:hypothetical protein
VLGDCAVGVARVNINRSLPGQHNLELFYYKGRILIRLSSQTEVVLLSKVKDPSLDAQGELKIEWARAHMPVLGKIQARFEKEQPFRGLSIGMCMHLEMKTAVLGEAFQAGGAVVAITGSNPLSTQDDGRRRWPSLEPTYTLGVG